MTGSTFTGCWSETCSCFYIDSEAVATLTKCQFLQCTLLKGSSSTTFPGDPFGGSSKPFGCIGGKGSLTLTTVKFIENQNGGVIIHGVKNSYTPSLKLTDCTFKDNVNYQYVYPVVTTTRGVDVVIGMYTTDNTITECTFETKHPLKGCAIRAHTSPVTCTDCKFIATDKDAVLVNLWRGNYNTQLIADMTLVRCSFNAPGICIETWASNTEEVTVHVQECVSFSGAKGSVCPAHVLFDNEDVILYDGVPCGGWPTSDQEDEPTTIDEPQGEPTTISDEENLEPGGNTQDTDGEIKESEEDKDPNNQDNDPKKPGLSGGEVAAIVVCLLLVVAAAIVLVWFFVLRNRRKERDASTHSDESVPWGNTEPHATNYDDDALAHQ